MNEPLSLFCFGLGYSARTLVAEHGPRFESITGTVRTAQKADILRSSGVNALVYDGGLADAAISEALGSATCLLVTAAPDAGGDPMLRFLRPVLLSSSRLKTVVYLSTVGVYGDHQGRWVDETTPVNPGSERAQRRVQAEQDWLDLGQTTGIAVQVHRLAGIYGPGRNAVEDMREGSARRIIKPGQVFNRIHVQDIAGAVMAGFDHPALSGIFNVCDDAPGPPQDVVAYTAELLDMPVPPDIPFAEAKLSDMARSFYSESKRCSNAKLRRVLNYDLRYPTFREGLAALVAEKDGWRA